MASDEKKTIKRKYSEKSKDDLLKAAQIKDHSDIKTTVVDEILKKLEEMNIHIDRKVPIDAVYSDNKEKTLRNILNFLNIGLSETIIDKLC